MDKRCGTCAHGYTLDNQRIDCHSDDPRAASLFRAGRNVMQPEEGVECDVWTPKEADDAPPPSKVKGHCTNCSCQGCGEPYDECKCEANDATDPMAKLIPEPKMKPVKACALVARSTGQFVRLTARNQSKFHRLAHVEITEVPR